MIQIVKERFGQRFRLTKAAHSTLTSCSVKHFFEVFNRFKTRLSDPNLLSLSGSGRRILQDQTLLSTPSKQPDENFSSLSNWRLSNNPFEAAHSTQFRRTVKLHFKANLLINKRFKRSILPDEEANYSPVRFSVKPFFSNSHRTINKPLAGVAPATTSPAADQTCNPQLTPTRTTRRLRRHKKTRRSGLFLHQALTSRLQQTSAGSAPDKAESPHRSRWQLAQRQPAPSRSGEYPSASE